MIRLEFQKVAAQAVGTTAALGLPSGSKAAARNPANSAAREYLRSIRPSRASVSQFPAVMTPEESRWRSNGWTYDPELGWVHGRAVHGTWAWKFPDFR